MRADIAVTSSNIEIKTQKWPSVSEALNTGGCYMDEVSEVPVNCPLISHAIFTTGCHRDGGMAGPIAPLHQR
jgi:hypothetical protein